MTDKEERRETLTLEQIRERLRETEEKPGVDYAEEYRRQTGKDLETDQYVVQ